MIAIFPKITSCVANGDREKLVCMIRQYFAGSEVYSAKLDMEVLIKGMGIPIEYMTIDSKAAIVAKDEKGKFRIVIVISRGLCHCEEKQFILAHLLGHYLLHIEPYIVSGGGSLRGFTEKASPMTRYGQDAVGVNSGSEGKLENEADNFAAALLMPLAFLRRAMKKLKNQDKVANFFGVPLPVLTRRLEDIGMMGPRPLGFFEAEGKMREGVNEAPMLENAIVPPTSEVGGFHGAIDVRKVKQVLAASSYKKEKTKSVMKNQPPKMVVAETVPVGQARAEKPDQLPIQQPEKTGEPSPQDALNRSNGNPTAKKNRGGMDRIREIARMIDATVK